MIESRGVSKFICWPPGQVIFMSQFILIDSFWRKFSVSFLLNIWSLSREIQLVEGLGISQVDISVKIFHD